MQKNIQKEQPRIEILGDHTVLYYADGRTSVLRGIVREDIVQSPITMAPSTEAEIMAPAEPRDGITRGLALGLSIFSGVHAVIGLGFGWLPRLQRPSLQQLVSQLLGSFTLRAYRRPSKALSHERDNPGPTAAAYPRAEIPAG